MKASVDQVKALMANPDFVERINALVEPEDVQVAFAENGVDLSLEEIDQIARLSLSNSEELSEDDLADVSGGSVVDGIVVVANLIKLGIDVITEYNNSRKSKKKKTIW